LESTAQKKKELKKTKTYKKLQEILNKTNKNYYVLLSLELNARICALNSEIRSTVGRFEEHQMIDGKRF
jgi:uncharacterized small protein (DUF1192 family)